MRATKSTAAATTTMESAPPPIHSQAILVVMLSFFFYVFPPLDVIDTVATLETFEKVRFPQYVSTTTVALIRLLIGTIFTADCIDVILNSEWSKPNQYLAGSKLKPYTIQFQGYFKQRERSILKAIVYMSSPFTMVSFLLLGLSFLFAGLIPLLHIHANITPSPWLLRFTLLSFECAAPTAVFIAAIVKYALWPLALKEGDSELFKDPRTLIKHCLNAVVALVEVGLLGEMPVRMRDISVAPLWGVAYILFSWYMADKWGQPAEVGPQYCYFFLDTTLGWTSSLCLLGLLLVLTVCYALFALADSWLHHAGGIVGSTTTILFLIVLVCRIRD